MCATYACICVCAKGCGQLLGGIVLLSLGSLSSAVCSPQVSYLHTAVYGCRCAYCVMWLCTVHVSVRVCVRVHVCVCV